jgi:predicted acetyltransferase
LSGEIEIRAAAPEEKPALANLFQLYPGLWEAAVARRNTGALAFWRKAVGGCPGLTEVQELDRRTKEWDGPILRFRIKSEPAGEPE